LSIYNKSKKSSELSEPVNIFEASKIVIFDAKKSGFFRHEKKIPGEFAQTGFLCKVADVIRGNLLSEIDDRFCLTGEPSQTRRELASRCVNRNAIAKKV
jgi:hypothetical protein